MKKMHKVKIVNKYDQCQYLLPVVIFQSDCVESIKEIIQAYCTHYSGDPIEVYIDDKEAILDEYYCVLDIKENEGSNE